jgi:hypothetical protein
VDIALNAEKHLEIKENTVSPALNGLKEPELVYSS